MHLDRPVGHRRAGTQRTLRPWPGGITTLQLWYYRRMRTISLKLPEEIDNRLEARARELGKTKSALTREALSTFLQGQPATAVSCLDLVQDLVGTVHGPRDLASNRKHMRGYGR